MDALNRTRHGSELAIHNILSTLELQIADDTVALKIRNTETGTAMMYSVKYQIVDVFRSAYRP